MNELEVQNRPSNETNNIVLLIWLGTLFFGFIPSLIIYLVKKDDALVTDQAKEALNWSITVMLGYAIGAVLTLILIGVLVIGAVGLCNLVFCILGAVNASKGLPYRLPFNIRLLK
ncbi:MULTISPECIES: DUF4870 domain-containing protein [Deefgea]|uniref:DUF4870 domain-containing protein n=1 Tax=Deefgea chitinilytica TaxID=570276 RepID=A0ABS2CDF1_9NEIS|nr:MULTISPECIES: DUF4870 domain-containing protein [Deefgea]MBM5571493.1 DUF4870 domain-containing protein [Deefgea chitinilytica]MBM9888726.1 DUF4870 domain-containing protein [Deefgea sp. CFH1-16]